jgi:preprotein translocase subunit SecE
VQRKVGKGALDKTEWASFLREVKNKFKRTVMPKKREKRRIVL